MSFYKEQERNGNSIGKRNGNGLKPGPGGYSPFSSSSSNSNNNSGHGNGHGNSGGVKTWGGGGNFNANNGGLSGSGGVNKAHNNWSTYGGGTGTGTGGGSGGSRAFNNVNSSMSRVTPPAVTPPNFSHNKTDHLLLMASQTIWYSDPNQGFLLGQIVDLGSDKVTVQPHAPTGYGRSRSGTEALQVAYESVYPAEDDSSQDYDDNCSLMYLNEATLLNNIRLRYGRQQIYTYTANMLTAVNPYVEIKGLYSAETIKRYQGKSLGTLPPHVFAIGDKAFRDMKVTKQSQSIIVSGESGAGKTESTKYILRYLCGSWGSTAGSMEQKILDANPVLESFGNAKTTRNNNSSRFGKFIEIHFEQNHKVTGGFISHYLLEKSRICSQSSEERNYHIFYQLLAGAPAELKKQTRLANKSLTDFHYLRQGCTEYFGGKGTLRDPIVDDIKDFQVMEKALSRLGLSDKDRLAIYSVVAAVLYLGNIAFEDDPDDQRGGCRVTDASESALKTSSELIGVDQDELRQALTSRVMQTAKGGTKGTVIMVPLKVYEANNARDALGKAMYSRMFDYIVHRINQSIPLKSSTNYIGVLDIAGFEFFTLNSFEQFCINYCNEKLQQFFNERVLHDEQTLYEKEGLGVARIEYIDNTDCIDLVESPKNGILSILDEESKLPKPSPTHFTSQVHHVFPNHFRLSLPRKSKIKEHREIRDDEGFLVRHFAGAVCYKTTQFIEKNNDALHASLEGLVQESRSPFLKELFALSSQQMKQTGKLTHMSVASKFRTQLSELLEKLRGTGTSFIRCIKPNAKMVPNVFEGGQILSQLQSAGMTSVLELMQRGFPSRVQFSALYATYKNLLPPKLSSLDPRFFCRALFKALGLSEDDFRFGLTRVFFRPGKFKEFDQLMRNDPESLTHMVATVTKWIIQSKWKKSVYAALSVIKLKNKIRYRRENLVVIQKTVRMHLARKRHRPRYRGIMQLRQLESQLTSMGGTVAKLKRDRETSQKELDKLRGDLAAAVRGIKSNVNILDADIQRIHQDLLTKCDLLLKTLSKRVEAEKNAEEQEKARKLREEMERQKREKEELERAKQLEEENRRKKAEIESRRKEEEAALAAKLALQKAAAPRLSGAPGGQGSNNSNNNGKNGGGGGELNNFGDTSGAAAFEQEKRDSELAFRLTQESNGNVTMEDMMTPTQLKRSNFVVNSRAGKKHDLSGWKYSQLRDAINTSCDVELLEACREEFHRRLKVYHAWKSRNRAGKGGSSEMDERAPKSIYQHQQSYQPSNSPSPPPGAPPKIPQQRYFRIPFTKDGQNRGLWFAHFDGQYIVRQMEIHQGKPPVLLIAGRDDMQMCELKLDETGLTRKRGAEILEYEFEKEWDIKGGMPYMRPSNRAAP